MKKQIIDGIIPIISTPINSKGNIVFEDLERQVEWLISSGVNGVGIAVASEIFKFNEKEKDSILKNVVKTNNGRVTVVMNTGGESTDLTIYNSEKAKDLGANSLMIRPTSFWSYPYSEHFNYFIDIANAVDLPIFLQDQPTAPVTPKMAVELANKHDNLAYVKVETPPTMPRVHETKLLDKKNKVTIFGGAGGAFAIEEFSRGSVGTMPHPILPEMFVKIWNEYKLGKIESAKIEHQKYSELTKILSQALGLAPWLYKYILVRRGIFTKGSDYAKLPSLRPDKEQYIEVDGILDRLGLL